MPPRSSVDRDSAVHFEPLRASVLDVFEQLGAFDEQSNIVEWIFPEFQEQKELQRARVKLTEVFDHPEPEPEPETPRKSRTSRFFRLGTKSRSKSRTKKETRDSQPSSKEPKKTTSSPNLRKDAAEQETSAMPQISSPMKHVATSPAEQKSRRLSLFPRKAPSTSLDQPRPSISDEEWQQITITGSIADYETNPFLGNDPHGNRQAEPVKRDRQKYFSRFTSGFTRSTPTSPTREHPPSSLSGTAPTSPTQSRPPVPATPERSASGSEANSNPTTPTGPYRSRPSPFVPKSPTGSAHSDASTSTLPAAPTSSGIQEVQRNDAPPKDGPDAANGALETTSQIDHVRKSLSDISEGEHSESSTLSVPNENRQSRASAAEAPAPEETTAPAEAPAPEEAPVAGEVPAAEEAS